MKKDIRISGFTLVEIMVAAAVMGGLALVAMQMTKTQTKSTVKASFDNEMLLTTNEIVAILSDPTKCSTTLGGKNAISTLSGILSINGKFFSIESGSTNSYGNANIQISNYQLISTPADLASNIAYLNINYQNKNLLKGTTGSPTVRKRVKIYVEVDGVNNITKCRSLSTSSADIWSRGAGSTINYIGGNVGIGTTTPEASLHVTGGNVMITGSGDIGNGFYTVNSSKTAGTQAYAWTAWNMTGAYENKLGFYAYAKTGACAGNLCINPLSIYDSGKIYMTGSVGIGTTTPSQMLDVIGTIKGTDIIITSDRRAKKQIAPLDNYDALEKVCKLKPVSYILKQTNKPDLGIVAQDLQAVFPELVIKNPDGTLSVKYLSLISPLIASVQALRSENLALKNQIQALKKENESHGQAIQKILLKLEKK